MKTMSAWGFDVRGQGTESLEIDIYDVVGSGGLFGGGVSAQDVLAQLKSSPNAKVKVRIHSVGGDVWDGMAIYSLLAERSRNVEVQIDGIAASIASVIAMAGGTRRMAANGFLMIHNPRCFFAGTAEDLRHQAEVLDKVRSQMAEIYACNQRQQGKRPPKTKAEILDAMDDETWLTASEARDWGFVDEVTGAVQMAACADMETLGMLRVPPTLLAQLTMPASIAQTSPERVEPVQLPESTSPPVEDKSIPYKPEKPVEDTSWDGPAAERRVRKWASKDGSGSKDQMVWAKYGRAFGWRDPQNAESFGGYKLIHHDVDGSTLTTSRAGTIAAAQALEGARGGVDIPQADMPGTRTHIGNHYKQFDMTPPWEKTKAEAEDIPAAQVAAQKEEQHMLAIATHLGLKDNATEADIMAVLISREADTQRLLASVEQKSVDGALGAIAAGRAALAAVPQLQAKIDELKVEADKAAAEKAQKESDDLLKVLRDEGKITPAQEKSLWPTLTLEARKAFASTATVVLGKDKAVEAKSSDAVPAVTTPDGKTWEQMTAMEKHDLHNSGVEGRALYAALKEDYERRTSK